MTESQSGPVYTETVDLLETHDALISECPCGCGCGELSEDGAECICCRTGVHNADQE